MELQDLEYSNFIRVIQDYVDKGRGESPAFLSWFLEMIYRLDPIDADDSICDMSNDKGIDGIYVDHTQQHIQIFQTKIKQRYSSIGDAPLRDLAGAMSQLDSPESVQVLLDGGANGDLKKILQRNKIKDLVLKGYLVKGIFLSNQPLDNNGEEFLSQESNISVYDSNRIASEYIDIDIEGGIKDQFTFDASYITPMRIDIGGSAVSYILPVKALELVNMTGIEDGSLFSQNVRQSLGNTKVNRALKESVDNTNEHKNFTLYHNGVNILCEEAKLENDLLVITNYVVVNGAQSISTFKRSSEMLTDDLRVIAKIIELKDQNLSKKITINSNNQNAIKPRDLKSTNTIQLRLREEFGSVENGVYELEIKRGQERAEGKVTITNEEAARLLLAFDLLEPESCHQVYKLFDDKYSEIFARPEVNAYRIIFLYKIMHVIENTIDGVNDRPLSRYGLTKYFLLSSLSEMLQQNDNARCIFESPDTTFAEASLDGFLVTIKDVLTSMIIDFNFEIDDMRESFDYKSDLKSSVKVRELRSKLLRSYSKDVSRGKAQSIDKCFT